MPLYWICGLCSPVRGAQNGLALHTFETHGRYQKSSDLFSVDLTETIPNVPSTGEKDLPDASCTSTVHVVLEIPRRPAPETLRYQMCLRRPMQHRLLREGLRPPLCSRSGVGERNFVSWAEALTDCLDCNTSQATSQLPVPPQVAPATSRYPAPSAPGPWSRAARAQCATFRSPPA